MNNNETIKDILAEMRDYAERSDNGGILPDGEDLRIYADRIEAAAKRDNDAALAAPARNCDRFMDEQDAQLAFLNEVWLISVDRDSMLERDRFENWTDEMRARYAKWLFAPAEGGAE